MESRQVAVGVGAPAPRRVSHELARRALAGLARLRLLRRVGLGRATRYVSLSFWLTFLDDAAELVLSLV